MNARHLPVRCAIGLENLQPGEAGDKQLLLRPNLSPLRHLPIVIAMYYADHDRAHFHARYGECRISLVLEWRQHHLAALRRNWVLARDRKPLEAIAPLE